MNSRLADIISYRTEYVAKFSSCVCDPDLFVDFGGNKQEDWVCCVFFGIFWGPSFKSITEVISNGHVVVN